MGQSLLKNVLRLGPQSPLLPGPSRTNPPATPGASLWSGIPGSNRRHSAWEAAMASRLDRGNRVNSTTYKDGHAHLAELTRTWANTREHRQESPDAHLTRPTAARPLRLFEPGCYSAWHCTQKTGVSHLTRWGCLCLGANAIRRPRLGSPSARAPSGQLPEGLELIRLGYFARLRLAARVRASPNACDPVPAGQVGHTPKNLGVRWVAAHATLR